MDLECSKVTTERWIMGMLFGTPRSVDYLVENGCNRMLFGLDTFEDLETILQTLMDSGEIKINKSNEFYLSAKGIFEIKKHTILPLLELTKNVEFYEAFIIANKNICDIEFIESLCNETEYSSITKIHEYTSQNIHKLHLILDEILKFKLTHADDGALSVF